MQMMEQTGQGTGANFAESQTLEINPGHPIIVNLNHLRKIDASLASLISHKMLDNIMMQSNIAVDINKSQSRAYTVLDKILDAELGLEQVPRAQRKQKPAVAKPVEEEAAAADQELKIEFENVEENDDEGALNKSQRNVKGKGSNTKISEGFTVNEEHFKK